MGCGNSKNQIGLVPEEKPGEAKVTSAKPKRASSRTIRVGQAGDSTPSRDRKSALRREGSWQGSKDSLGSQTSLGGRGGSASSKKTIGSGDSGIDDDHYHNYITEGSDVDMVRKVEEDFREPNMGEFNLVGTAVPRRQSANDKDRQQEASILNSLRQEGLIQRPMSRAQGGLSFEVVEDANNRMLPSRPPIRLAKLEKRQKKHKRTLTSEDIEAKLEKAEARKKELENQRLQRIQSITNQSDVNAALDSFAKSQEVKTVEIKSKDEIAAENRERKLLALQAKLKAKQDRAEAVRLRRLSVVPQPNEDEEPMPVRVSHNEDTPVGRSGAFDDDNGDGEDGL